MNNKNNPEFKELIDIQLSHYPKLNELVGNDNKRYTFYRPYMYDTKEHPQLSTFRKKIEDSRPQLDKYCEQLRNCPPEKLNRSVVTSIFENARKIAPWLDWSKIYNGQCSEHPSKELIEQICEHLSTDPSLDDVRLGSEIIALGGVLSESKSDGYFRQYLLDIESFLKKYPIFSGDAYKKKICLEFLDVYAEMKVYDQLVNMGFDPEHEPEVCKAGSKPDFRIYDSDGNPYFIEVKCRYESFDEVLQSFGYSEHLPQTRFMALDDDTRKSLDVIISPIGGQITKWNSALPDVPTILVVESRADFFGLSLNIKEEHFKQRLQEKLGLKIAEIPGNLKAVVIFSCSTYLKREGMGDKKYPVLAVYPLGQWENELLDKLKNMFTQPEYQRG